jgi:hypothetical protein
MNKKKHKVGVAVCIDSAGSEDLQLCKVYRALADTKAAELGCLRVIDDSGEDYLYPALRFVVLELPQPTRKQLLAVINADAA